MRRLLAGGAAVVLAGVIGISQPWSWMLATKAGDTGDNKKTPWTTDGGDRTSLKEPGIQPNSTSTEGSQDASQTTGANSKKGNTIERYPDAKGGNKKRIVSNAGMKQGAIDKAPREGYEGVDDPVSTGRFFIRFRSYTCANMLLRRPQLQNHQEAQVRRLENRKVYRIPTRNIPSI
jgi:hypothetical protein